MENNALGRNEIFYNYPAGARARAELCGAQCGGARSFSTTRRQICREERGGTKKRKKKMEGKKKRDRFGRQRSPAIFFFSFFSFFLLFITTARCGNKPRARLLHRQAPGCNGKSSSPSPPSFPLPPRIRSFLPNDYFATPRHRRDSSRCTGEVTACAKYLRRAHLRLALHPERHPLAAPA